MNVKLFLIVKHNYNGNMGVPHHADPGIEKLDQCHILFICASEKNQLSNIIQRLNNASVLTVADMEGFTSAGGMINLVMQDNKVSFDINLKSARLAGLKISSRLLKLANTVRE